MVPHEIASSQALPDLVWIPGGTFRMGSENFYPEERPVREVTVDGFWMDRYAVTNDQFSRFVAQTGYVTVAERAPRPEDFPGAPPENLVPGSMVFQKRTGPVDLRNYANWWAWVPERSGAIRQGRTARSKALAGIPSFTLRSRTSKRTRAGRIRISQPRPSGSLPRVADSMGPHSRGGMTSFPVARPW
jgi:hypothetical protein